MNWIFVSIALSICSVALYLLLRKSQQMGVSNMHNNLAMFALPTVGYALMGAWQHASFFIPWWQFGLLALVAIFCSYLGNKLSLKSVQLAANPGFSLMISKNYVVFTTLVAVVLFHSELTVKNAVAILCIVGFSALISIGKPTKKENGGYAWLMYSLGAFFAWGVLALFSKYFVTIGIALFVRLFYLSFIVTILVTIELWLRKQSLFVKKSQLGVFLGMSVASMGFNGFMQLGYAVAPNPGYVNAVNAASIAALTIFSAWIFRDELTWPKLIGIFGVSLGLIMLFL